MFGEDRGEARRRPHRTRRSVVVGLLAVVALGVEAAPTVGQAAETEPLLGRPASLDLAAGSDAVPVAAGTRLLRNPDLHSTSVAMVDVAAELPVLARRERWVLVRYGAWQGWIPVAGGSVATGATGSRLEAPGSVAPDAAILESAKALLGDHSEISTLGPFGLLTDCDDTDLLAFLSDVAERLPATYARRYGLDPGAPTREVLVVFSRTEDYEAFAASAITGAGNGSPGMSGRGLAVFSIGERTRGGVAALLVHELTHLLNRRVMVELPRPWLEEGMANDLAFCAIGPAGDLDCGRLGGSRVEIERALYQPGGWLSAGTEVRLSGPRAALSLIRDRWQVDPVASLTDLVGLGWGEFSDPAGRVDHYDASAFFVRYLEQAEEARPEAGFRTFLQAVAQGGAAGQQELEAYLGRDWKRIGADFAAWMEDEVSAAP